MPSGNCPQPSPVIPASNMAAAALPSMAFTAFSLRYPALFPSTAISLLISAAASVTDSTPRRNFLSIPSFSRARTVSFLLWYALRCLSAAWVPVPAGATDRNPRRGDVSTPSSSTPLPDKMSRMDSVTDFISSPTVLSSSRTLGSTPSPYLDGGRMKFSSGMYSA